jgi:WD40 repeat protein
MSAERSRRLLCPFAVVLLSGADPAARTDRHGDPLPDGATARFGTVRFRESFAVNSIAYSPDGKMIAAGGAGRSVGLWDAETGKEVRRLEGLSDANSVAFSPDGRFVAGAGWPDARVWEVATGNLAFAIKGHTASPRAIVYSPDGKFIVTGSHDRTIRIWDAADGHEVAKIEGHAESVLGLAFAPDGQTIASASSDLTARVWSVATRAEVRRFGPFADPAERVAFSPDGKTLVTTCQNSPCKAWDVETGKELFQLGDGKKEHARFAGFSPDGKLLATTHADQTLRLSDPATGKEVRRWHAGSVRTSAVAFAPDGKTVAGAGIWDCAIRRWDVATGKEHPVADGHTGVVRVVMFTPDGSTLVSVADDHRLIYWDVAAGRVREGFAGPANGGLFRPALSADGKRLAAVTWVDKKTRVCDADAGREIGSYDGDADTTNQVAMTADGMKFATAARDGTVRVRAASDGRELNRLKHDAGTPGALEFSADGRQLGVASGRTVVLWDLKSGKELHRMKCGDGLAALAFTPDGRTVIGASAFGSESSVVAWSVETGERLRQFETAGRNGGYGLAVSRDGRLLALGGAEPVSVIQVWELATGQEAFRLRGHHSAATSVAFSPDCRTLASGGGDTTVLLWDITGGKSRPFDAERAWADLSEGAAKALPAVWAMASNAEAAVPVLRERVRPAAAPDAGTMKQLLVELGGKDFRTRERGESVLKKLGPGSEPALRQALQGDISLDVSRRLERRLAELENTEGQARSLRAVQALEYAGTDAARKALENLAAGEADSRLTREAKASLKRMER